ncbi:MAG: MBL fold metallo-hydrolase [Gammaproteobacteria bacterium]
MTDELLVEYITHACLKFRGDFGTLICDPWILNEPVANFSLWKFPPATLPPEQVVADVDWIYITHSHEDHLHVPSLVHFSRTTPVLISSHHDHRGARAQSMERTLRAIGFSNIRILEPWQPLQLGTRSYFTVIPHAPSRPLGWEDSGFVLEHGETRVINLNDNNTDDALCDAINERFDHFDLALVQAAGLTIFPGQFRMSEAEMRSVVAGRRLQLSEQRRIIEQLKPRAIIPIGGDVCWLDDELFHCNWANRSTPALFEEFVAREFPDSGTQVIPCNPGDTWSSIQGVRRQHPDIDWNHYLDEIKALKQRYQPRLKALRSWLLDCSRENLEARSREFTAMVASRISREKLDFNARLRLVVEHANGDQAFSFVLDASREFGLGIDWEDTEPVGQSLYVQAWAWAAVLSGKLLWNDLHWIGQIEQHRDFSPEMGYLWAWLQSNLSLGNTNIQAIIEPWPGLSRNALIALGLGVTADTSSL